MSHQVYARQRRPKQFAELIGQSIVLRTLQNALQRQRVHHAYLFSGIRGVGKTTLARILAKALNCEQGIGAEPCGACSACLTIDAGNFIDLLEIDAASRTKVEDTRDLLENVPYAPSQGRYKVYLIDEVHMLSGHSFNALLKTLEEPPAHVVFILATTDPDKLPLTVRSRCLQLRLNRLDETTIAQYLQTVLDEEQIPAEQAAVMRLAQAADGSVRDALSLLEQATALSHQQTIQDSDVAALLGADDEHMLLDLIAALHQQDKNALQQTLQSLAEQSVDYSLSLRNLLQLLQQMAMQQVLPSDPPQLPERAYELCQQLSPETLQLYYQIALICQRDLPYAATPRSGFEMGVLRMFAFERDTAHVKPSPAKPAQASTQQDEPSWAQLIEQLPVTGLAKNILQNCIVAERQTDHITLHMAQTQTPLLNDNVQQRIEEALQAHYQRNLQVHIVPTATVNSPAQQQRLADQEQFGQAKQHLANDEIVQDLQRIFDAELQHDSITPISNERDL